MRCKNCGWPNKPGETKCVKCNSPLSSHEEEMDFVERVDYSQSERPLNKTVFEGDAFESSRPVNAPHYDNQQTIAENSNLAQCPKCGYPLRAGVDKCPNCKFQINSSRHADIQHSSLRSATAPEGDGYHRPTRLASGTAPKNNFRGTINPYMMNVEAEPSFILKPIKRIDERHELDSLEYEGKEVVLNRDNTEQNNPSITSRQQATITNVDGRWYIEDKSEQKTTFVQASQKIELHDGDIILLGNRLFEFHK